MVLTASVGGYQGEVWSVSPDWNIGLNIRNIPDSRSSSNVAALIGVDRIDCAIEGGARDIATPASSSPVVRACWPG